jgi:hypothetical protein
VRKLTVAEFIERATKAHGVGTYDYSLVEYLGGRINVTIICPVHGNFEQFPHEHLDGCGCPECGGRVQLTSDEFSERAAKKHSGKYDYSLVEYVNAHTNVTIICPIDGHPDFKQEPNNHLRGAGCPACGGVAQSNTAKFIDGANRRHGVGRYAYSRVVYINAWGKVSITCLIPKHGDFLQAPAHHLEGKGCPKCGIASSSILQFKRRESASDRFEAEASKVHGVGRYTYGKMKYRGAHIKIIITCPEHGDFWQTPNGHLKGSGCSVCSESHGERVIRHILGEILPTTGVDFVQEHRILECTHKRPLPFDFAVMERGVVVGLIEYQGEQHYTPIRFASLSDLKGTQRLEVVRERDAIKVRYAAAEGIPLLIIPYWDFCNIESLVTGFLRQL